MTQPHPAQSDHPPGYEDPGINLRGVVWFIAVFIPFVIATHVLIWLIYSHYYKTAVVHDDATTALPQQPIPLNAPPLQPSPGHDVRPKEDLAAMRAREQAEFARRGWIDGRIPDSIVEQVSQMSAKQPTTRPQP
jgi:hypothetical protein